MHIVDLYTDNLTQCELLLVREEKNQCIFNSLDRSGMIGDCLGTSVYILELAAAREREYLEIMIMRRCDNESLITRNR